MVKSEDMFEWTGRRKGGEFPMTTKYDSAERICPYLSLCVNVNATVACGGRSCQKIRGAISANARRRTKNLQNKYVLLVYHFRRLPA